MLKLEYDKKQIEQVIDKIVEKTMNMDLTWDWPCGVAYYGISDAYEKTGKEVEKLLDAAHITANKNTVPNDPESPFVTSGLRIGTPAVTTRGFKENDMEFVGKVIADIILNRDNPEILNNYVWKNISLVELLRGDYNYLIEKFILNPKLVPNNESYINNYEFHELSIKYPFSLKELYKIFVDRGIDITIDNYYYFENQKKYIIKK